MLNQEDRKRFEEIRKKAHQPGMPVMKVMDELWLIDQIDSLLVPLKGDPGEESRLAQVRDRLKSRSAIWGADVEWLLSLIDGRDSMISDLLEDSNAYQHGRDSAFAEILVFLKAKRRKDEAEKERYGEYGLGRVQSDNVVIEEMLKMSHFDDGKCPPALPPVAARAEIDRLRHALKRIMNNELPSDGVDDIEACWAFHRGIAQITLEKLT